ncbi:MAG: hypothetical protein U9R28_11550 [Pseudomonadota bacterium]|nr:hypothetical protein [Pseudomonadota bacterium]
MKVWTKLLIISVLVILNSYLISFVDIAKTDIKQFFPEAAVKNQSDINTESRYLFIATQNPDSLYELEENQLIDGILNLPGKEDVFLVFFNETTHEEVIQKIEGSSYMGTSIVGTLLSEEFIEDLTVFLLVFIPLIIPLLAYVTSVKFVVNTIGEVLAFSALILAVIVYFDIALNSAYLLALLFSYIYVFTLINQVYFNKTGTWPLALSLFASLATTWLSAFLLSFSGFGVIRDFGYSLMIWIGMLLFYLGLRLFIRSRTPHNLEWFKLKAPIVRMRFINLFLGSFLLSAFMLIDLSPIHINLNPLGMSAHKQAISEFEENSSLSQPILMTIESKGCSLRALECNQKLSELIKKVENQISLKFEPVLDLNTLYSSFTEEKFDQVTSAKFAQFKLGMDMMSIDRYLYGKDFNSANYIASISLLEPVASLLDLKQSIEQLNSEQDTFQVVLQGHLSQIGIYQKIFIDEMLWSVTSILLLLAFLFLVFFKKLAVLVSLLPAGLAIIVLLFMHSLFDMTLSVMTLIAIILFIGLITDNVIHILMTYRMEHVDCFKRVFKPIILSNLILIISLSLMALVNHGFLKIFGLELAILLLAHLIFLVYLLPTLFLKTMPKEVCQLGRCEE